MVTVAVNFCQSRPIAYQKQTCEFNCLHIYIYTHRIHGAGIYMLTWLGYIDGIHVTIYGIHASYGIYIYIHTKTGIHLTQTHLKVWNRFGFSVRPTSGPLGVPLKGVLLWPRNYCYLPLALPPEVPSLFSDSRSYTSYGCQVFHTISNHLSLVKAKTLRAFTPFITYNW